MPCDSYYDREAVERARLLAEREAAMRDLDERLATGRATVTNDNGVFAIEGWDAADVDMTDLCALADIAMHGSMAARVYVESKSGGADLAAIHGHS